MNGILDENIECDEGMTISTKEKKYFGKLLERLLLIIFTLLASEPTTAEKEMEMLCNQLKGFFIRNYHLVELYNPLDCKHHH